MYNLFINDSDNNKLKWSKLNDQSLDNADQKDSQDSTDSLFANTEKNTTTKFDLNDNISILSNPKFTTKNNNELSSTSLFAKKDDKTNKLLTSNPFSIQKTTKTDEIKKTTTEQKVTDDTEITKINSPEAKKDYASIDKTMDELTKGKYSKLTPLEKSQEIAKAVEAGKFTNEKDKDNGVIKQFKTVLTKAKNEKETVLITNAIQHLDKKNQLDAVKTAVTLEDKDKNKTNLIQKTVAAELPKLDKTVQVDATKAIVDTKNVEAIKISAEQVSKLDATRKDDTSNQVEAVKVLEKADLEEKDQKDIDKTIIDQYAKIDKESQLDVHKTMSASKLSNTVEYAAGNIYHMDKENQADAVKATIETNNEEAVEEAAEQYNNYDDSAKSEIKSEINETDYTGAKETLEQAENSSDSISNEYNSTYDKDDNDNSVDNDTDNRYNNNTENIENDSIDYGNANIEEIENAIEDSKDNAVELQNVINELSDIEKIALLEQKPSSDVVNAILKSHPTLSVLEKIDPETLKELGFKNIGSLICFLSFDGQKAIVEQAAQNGSLSEINRDYLLGPIKVLYDKLKKQEQEKNNKLTHHNNKLEITA